MDLLKELEERLLPAFRHVSSQIKAELPNVQAVVRSFLAGTNTNRPCQCWSLECLIPQPAAELPDNVSLVVSVEQLNTNPMITADVCWGSPIGYIEAEALPEPISFNAEGVKAIESQLSVLYEALKVALRRGRPPKA
jgi:hypothetical protein